MSCPRRPRLLGGVLLLAACCAVPATADDVELTAGKAPPAAAVLDAAGAELGRVVERVRKSVVHIQADRGRTEETGSGVLITSPHFSGPIVVTNRHVVSGAVRNRIDIRLYDGRILHPSALLEDPHTDLAVLKVDCDDALAANWGDSNALEIGHFVLAMGSPFGLSQSVTVGIISAKSRRALDLGTEREILNQDFLQTDAAINPGNSGGPLINLRGEVVGINTAIASQGGGNEGIGFSIPSTLVEHVVNELLQYGEVKRGYLGVRLDDSFDEEMARRYNLDRPKGARVLEIYPDSPAERAGLAVDDLILSVDGVEVEDENHLIHRVSLMPVNSRVHVVILRAGRTKTLELILTERPKQKLNSQLAPAPQGRRVLPSSLELAAVTDSIAVQTGVERPGGGLLVLRTDAPRTRDAAPRLELYDIIVEAARRPITGLADLDAVLAQHPDDEAVLLKVLRFENGRTEPRLVLLPLQRTSAP